MKRLLAQIGITYYSVLAAAFYLSDFFVVIIGGIAALLVILFFIIKRARQTIFLPAMAIAALAACIINIGYTALFVKPYVERYGGAVHTVRAEMADEAYRSYSKYYYKLNVKEIDGEKVGQKLLLKTIHPLEAETDDILTFTSELKATDSNYYRAKGYFLNADSFEISVNVKPADHHSLYYYALQLRQYMRKALDTLLPKDCAALCRAVLIGDKYALGTEVRDNFRYAGASYFIVVSGMHFAVICLLIERLLRRIRLNRWVRLAIILVFILAYAALTGFQPSVLRSGIMMTMLMIANTIRRQTYPLNHLGIAGIIMPFIVSPYGAGDIGLILSFYATLAILMWASPIAKKLCRKDQYGNILTFQPGAFARSCCERIKGIFSKDRTKKPDKQPFSFKLWLTKLYNAIALMLSVSLAANILTFPISVFVFREISLVTLLSALLLYWEIYLILILSFAVCVFFWLRPLAVLLSFPLMWLCKLVLWIVDGLSSLPFAYIRISQEFVYVWLIFTVLLGIAVILYRNHYRCLKTAALCSAIILLTGCVLHEILQISTLSLEVYPCGGGICAGINSGGHLHLLSMDAKSKELYDVWDSLYAHYDGADSAFCGDEDDLRKYQMYREDEFAISKIMLYDKKGLYKDEENIVSFDDDCTMITDDEIVMNISVNDGVAVLYVDAGNKTILIVPDGCRIEDIPPERRQADVIILSKAIAGMENLRCGSLIVSDDSMTARRTADALKACYQHVYFTDNGDVRCRLR